MKKWKIVFVFFCVCMSGFTYDHTRGYGFLECSMESDLDALVKIIRPFQQGYLCRIDELLYSKTDSLKNNGIIWGSNDFDFGAQQFNVEESSQYLVAVRIIASDRLYENEFSSLCEKKGTYYLPDIGCCYIQVEDHVVKGRLYDSCGWVKGDEGKDG